MSTLNNFKMKRSLVLLIFTILISRNSYCQGINFVGGLTMNSSKYTYNLSPIPFSNLNPVVTNYQTVVGRSKFRPNFFVGVNLDVRVINNAGISTGLVFIRRSMSNDNTDPHQQIGVPLSFTYRFLSKYKLVVGPQIDFLIGSDMTVFDKINTSGTIGLRYQPIGKIQFGFGFNRNLSSILNENFVQRTRSDYNTFLISAGYPI